MGKLFANFEPYDVQATRKEARAEGVVNTVKHMGGTMEMAVQQLIEFYDFDEAQAQEKVKLYW